MHVIPAIITIIISMGAMLQETTVLIGPQTDMCNQANYI
jgi:hypothetical protein